MDVKRGWDCAGTSRGNHAALLAQSRSARPAWSRLRTRKVNAGHDQSCGRGKNRKKKKQKKKQNKGWRAAGQSARWANCGVQNPLEKRILLLTGIDHTLHTAVSA